MKGLQREGNAHRQEGNFDAALNAYQGALVIDPNYLPAWLGCGLLHFEAHDYLASRKCFHEAHRLDPTAVDPAYFLAQADEALNLPTEALAWYQQALSLNPSFLPALRALAPLAHRLGQIETAEKFLRQAISYTPAEPELHLLLGLSLNAAQRFSESKTEFDVVLKVQADRLEALIGMAEALCSLEQYDDAFQLTKRLDGLAPERSEVQLINARVLYNYGRIEEAAVKAEHLLSSDPDSVAAEFILGLVRWHQMKVGEAKAHWERAVRLDPGFSESWMWLATLLFFQKDYRAAWPAYEKGRFGFFFGASRADTLLLKRLGFSRRWTGEPDAEGTLYVWAEQGLGDTLMLLTIIMTAATAFKGKIFFYCPPPLLRLAQQIVDPERVLIGREMIPDGALHCPLFSLPIVLQSVSGTTWRPEARAAYLVAPDGAVRKFSDRLRALTGFKIGIVWDGAGGYKANSLRSVPLRYFGVIAEIAGVTLVSLQKDPPKGDVPTCSFPLIDWTDEIEDLGDTAAIMKGLDLVISIDSAPAHLAGALGVPVWLLNRFDGEWRWGRARSDNDWYRSMRVFYQAIRKDWQPVFRQMATELEELVKS